MKTFIEKFKGSWTRYLVQFPFEWWVTVSYKDLPEGTTVKSEYAKVKLKVWIRKLIKEERLQIAYFGVINKVNRIHLHLLILGRNRFGKTLLDVSPSKWEKEWKAMAKISPIYDLAGVSKYFERNTILWDNTLSEVIDFNSRLLKNVQKTNGIEIDSTNLLFSEIANRSTQDSELIKNQMVNLINGFKN
jgi:hypothetical protein